MGQLVRPTSLRLRTPTADHRSIHLRCHDPTHDTLPRCLVNLFRLPLKQRLVSTCLAGVEGILALAFRNCRNVGRLSSLSFSLELFRM
jgi:hypothetical protein